MAEGIGAGRWDKEIEQRDGVDQRDRAREFGQRTRRGQPEQPKTESGDNAEMEKVVDQRVRAKEFGQVRWRWDTRRAAGAAEDGDGDNVETKGGGSEGREGRWNRETGPRDENREIGQGDGEGRWNREIGQGDGGRRRGPPEQPETESGDNVEMEQSSGGAERRWSRGDVD